MIAVPQPLDQETVEAKVIRTEIWHRINRKDQHFMGALVGPEGSGKSWTALKIAEVVDPSFSAERIMFDPATFIDALTEWKDAGETRGKMIVVDEAGVGIGSRSWYDKDQIQLNKVLQVIRSENMGMLFTLPRLSELDSQTRGRLRAMIEMSDMVPGEYADVKYLRWLPARDERNKVYRQYPVINLGGERGIKVRRLRIGPPSPELVKGYEARKDAFQAALYAETTDQLGDDDGNGKRDVTDIAEEIWENSLEDYIAISASNKVEFVDKELIAIDYDLSGPRANKVKKLLDRKRDAQAEDGATA